ncbi:MAG: hypothetical protein AAGI91_05340 [Bacteroidota bacterium]
MTTAESLDHLLARLDAHLARLADRSRRLSRWRIATFLAGLVAALGVGNTFGAGAGWAVAGIAALGFYGLAKVHDRVEAARARARLWRGLQARHLARLGLDWDDLGPAPHAADPAHPFAADLDLAGPRSLLHLMDTTGTEMGHERLRSWLLAEVPDAEAARARQGRVRGLAGRRRLRDRLALLAHEAAGSLDRRWSDAPVRTWLRAPAPPFNLVLWATVLSALALLTFVLAGVAFAGGPTWWWVYSLAAYGVLYLSRIGGVWQVFDQAYDLQQALRRLMPALTFLERQGAPGDALGPLWRAFEDDRSPAAFERRLRWIVTAAEVTRNEFGRLVVNVLLPYDLLLAVRLDRLRGAFETRLVPWLDALAEIEALSALATWADFRPAASSFPDLLGAGTEGPLFAATDLRHPLLPTDGAVGNDIELGGGHVAIVTGSNMSGKSTFLRSIGVATVLAWTGGPVAAGALAVQPLRPFTSMRIGDVLQDGISTFYGEVRRLRALLDGVEADGPPALVLIDEMLRGTNNRERLAGAEAVVRALAEARATSLVATHDLALTNLADERPDIRNLHFREEAAGDRLVFDYRLRPGPCPTTNALVIMHRAGLPVEAPASAEG